MIKWRLTDVCNYNRPYCVRKVFVDETNLTREQDLSSLRLKNDLIAINKAMLEIARIINELSGLTKLDLIGGEVSLFNLKEILEAIFNTRDKKLHRISMTTNMFRSASYYNDLIDLCKAHNSAIGITCSMWVQ